MSIGIDSPREMACLDRSAIWQGLIEFCEELEKNEIEAKVGQSERDPAVMMSSFSDPGGMAALKRPKTAHKPKRTAGGDTRPTWDPKTMTRAVARDLGLI